jgi:alkylation response protein AidB-like acyl-CoA dehydrogenase
LSCTHIFLDVAGRNLWGNFGQGPDVIGGGSVRPEGSAVKSGQGWTVSGRWGFASGCQHADWLYTYCVEMLDRAPAPGTIPGMPKLRMIVLPAASYRIIENWDTVGLCGSASHDIVLEQVLVPDPYSCEIDLTSRRTNSIVGKTALHLAALALGIAEGSLDDLTAIVRGGKQSVFTQRPLIDSVLALETAGRHEADVKAARAYLRVEAQAFCSMGEDADDAAITSVMQAATWVCRTCSQSVDAAFGLSGTSAIRAASSLQRRMRDIRTLMQHSITHPRNYIAAGGRSFGLNSHPFRVAT